MKDYTRQFDQAAAPRFERKPKAAAITIMFRASINTKHFAFTAYGHSHDEAWGALVQGLKRHGAAHSLPSDWFGALLSEISVQPITLGMAYRDGEMI